MLNAFCKHVKVALAFPLKEILLFLLMSIVLTANITAAQPIAELSGKANADLLLEKHTSLIEQLSQNQYRRPLFLESIESNDKVSSTVYAVLDSPFSIVSTTFKQPVHWCEILILHINTKYCRANSNSNSSVLAVNIGKKTPQRLEEAFLLEFSYRVTSALQNYIGIQLYAAKGPLSTTDYQLEFQAVPLPDNQTFIYLRYSYSFGLTGRLAMQTYLATLGYGKVGFTKVAKNREKNAYVEGVRGAVERNTMRYYLAIEAYLDSLKKPASQQINSRFQYWFNATEEYPQQLHEVTQDSYLSMKKDEYQRQQALPATVN